MSEVWKWIPGYKRYYKCSSYGRVKSTARIVGHNWGGTKLLKSKIMKQTLRGGYPTVGLYKDDKRRTFRVHELVLLTFVGPRPKNKECRHLNDDRTDSRLSNLKYGTHQRNMKDSVVNGRTPRKIQPDQVRHIRKVWKESTNKRGLLTKFAKELNVTPGAIWFIVNKRNGKSIR